MATKAAAIIDMLARHPDKGPMDISKLLKAAGVDASPKHISVVKSKSSAKQAKPSATIGAVNKSKSIREALKANRGRSAMEISALLKAAGVDASPTYVSNIKSSMKARRKARRAKPASNEAPALVAKSPINAAVEFIKAAGGMEAAKAALGTVEEIRSL